MATRKRKFGKYMYDLKAVQDTRRNADIVARKYRKAGLSVRITKAGKDSGIMSPKGYNVWTRNPGR